MTNTSRLTKAHMTRKQAANRCDYIVQAGYCELQNLLDHLRPVAYNAGAYGWNWDMYELFAYDETATRWVTVGIVTGYRNLIGENIDPITLADVQQAAENLAGYEQAQDLADELARKIVNA